MPYKILPKHGYNLFIRDKDGELYLNNTEYVDDMSDETLAAIRTLHIEEKPTLCRLFFFIKLVIF